MTRAVQQLDTPERTIGEASARRARVRARSIAALVGCACAGAAACHTPRSALPAPVARFQAASGGARWSAIGAIETTAAVSVGGIAGTVVSVEDVRTGRYRTTTTLGALVLAEGFDGAGPWRQAVGGEVETPDAPDALALDTTTRWLTARGYFRDSGARYRELGARTLGDRRLHAVEATPADGAPVELWFDDATGYLAQIRYRQGIDTVTTTYDDYRAVEGVELPFRTVSDPGDPRNRATMTATEIRVHSSVADTAFARPRTDGERLRFADGAGATRLPFELINNHIYIHARVDDQPVRMLVDTGGLNILTPAAAARLGLTSTGKLAVSGTGDRKLDLGLARGRELAVGDVRLAAPVFYVIDLEALGDVEGEAFDGLVGFELFHRLAVRIDYPGRTLTLIGRDAFVAPAGAIVVPFVLTDRTPTAAGSIDGIPARFTIDTGARTSVSTNSPFTRANKLEARYRPAFETIVGWGVGGPARGKPVRFQQIKLGDAAIADVAGDLFTGDKGALSDPDSSANLGGGVLKRFVVTFDYHDRKMFLEAAAGVPRDVYDRAGMFILRSGEALRVGAVVAGGPAARAGIAPDDRIVAIDGAPVASRPLWQWRATLGAGEVGARHTLTVEAGPAGSARSERTIVLAELLP